jgi:6,7-dimethyl-8-ribityllumazine synthase|tara:strand:+ start:16653 stop:17171 length:519 start_codon:yes stop_codon:yes gene_type:complete
MARPVHPVAILVSRYNESVTGAMLAGAVEAYAERGGDPAGLTIVEAPGAYELVALANAAADRHKAIVCLGCVIKGETPHDEHIARAIAHGLSDITVKTGIPVAFGVLTTLDAAQAKARASGKKGNKGAEAMHAALDAAEGVAALRHGPMPVRHTVQLTVPDKAAGQTALRGG